MARSPGVLGVLLLLVSVPGCTPSNIVGPLKHQQEERTVLLARAKNAGMSTDLLDKVVPPLTPEEEQLGREQDSSCRNSYMWKNGLTWTGSLLVAAAAGVVIGGAYGIGNSNGSSDQTTKIAFGVSAGSLAALGSALVAVGGIIQSGYTDRGCTSRMDVK